MLIPILPMTASAPTGTFPVIAATNTSRNSGATAHAVSLPAGISVGDMLIAIFGPAGNPAVTEWDAGWTELGTPGTAWPAMRVAYRIADGTEGASVTFTTSVAATSQCASFRVTGHDSVQPSISTYFHVTTTSIDVPALTPAGGAKNYLWVAIAEANNSSDPANNTWSSVPANYTQSINDTAQFYPCVGVAWRNLNAATEDPGTFINGIGVQDKKAVLIAIGAL